MMQLLRKIADDGRTVVLTTHATANVKLCDKIVVLARDGHLAFYGTPDEALRYFGVSSFDEIYDRLADELSPEEWGDALPRHAGVRRDRGGPDRSAPIRVGRATPSGRPSLARASPRAFTSSNVLSRRNFDLYARFPARTSSRWSCSRWWSTLLMLALFKADLFSLETEQRRTCRCSCSTRWRSWSSCSACCSGCRRSSRNARSSSASGWSTWA